ncbi:MAG: pseudaminic acid cytidylyltransferase [Salibacteraceae bacterium]|jgi:N-acylneuraminate cytidylyltransferase
MVLNKICIIPARGGSQRIPRKNIRDFLGKPIIAYAIEAALSSQLFDEVMVSTDDVEIAEIAKKYGASVPFLRNSDNSGSMSTTYDVIREVTDEFANLGMTFTHTCCLYATSPFVNSEKLKSAFNQLIQTGCEAVFTVQEYSYPIQRSLVFKDDVLEMKWPEHLKSRSQDLEKSFHDCGQFYFYDTQAYLNKGGVFKMNSSAIIISELESQDIDTETDWKLAELKYTLIK